MATENAGTHVNQSLMLTRRSLISGAAVLGALHFLGSFASPGGVTMAYADDAGQTHFKVYVLSREEVPVISLNVRNKQNTPVEGMKVTIISRVNDQSVTVYTDEYGCAIANIRTLADNADDNTAGSYGGWMRIEGELDGWQRFIETKRLVESGVHADPEGNMPNTIQVPTMSDVGSVYLSCLCLDGVDVKYLPQTVGLNAESNMLHTLEVRVENTSRCDTVSKKWEFYLCRDRDEEQPIMEPVYADHQDDGIEVTLSGVWLDGKHGIEDGDDAISLYFSPTDNPNQGMISLPLTFENVVLPVPGLEEDYFISPGQQPTKDKQSNLGTFLDWFVCNTDRLNNGIPLVPVEIFIDVNGNCGISATLLTCSLYKYKDGKKEEIKKEDRWKTFEDNSGDTGWMDKYLSDLCDNAERWLDTAMDGDEGALKAFGASPVTTKLTATFTVELQGYGSMKNNEVGDYHYHGDMAIIARFAVNFMAAQQLTVAYIPVYWMFDFKAQALFKLLSGIQFDEGLKNFQFGHELAGSYNTPYAIVFVFEIEAGFTVGVGVMGILSIGIRGYGNLNLTASTDTDGGTDAVSPHLTITGRANIQLSIQALLFKQLINLTHWGPWTLYDNWDSNAKITGAAGSIAFPNNRFGATKNPARELATSPASCNDLEQVSEESLAACAEFSGTLNALGLFTYGKNSAGNPAVLTSSGGTWFVSAYRDEGVSIRDPYAGAAPIAEIGAPFGAEGYNPLRGIHPTTQTLLWQDVFSAPRTKVIQVGAETYMLRISTVTVEIDDNNENLQLVQDSADHVFVKAKPNNTLPAVKLSTDGESLEYPDLGPNVCVAHIDSFDAGFEADEKDASGTLLGSTPKQLASLVADLNNTSSATFASTKPANTSYVTRSRLTISRFLDDKWQEPQVIDFVLPTTAEGYLRANTWDVDFDAVGYWNNTKNKYRIYILLSSIVRVVDDTTFEEQFKNQFLTLLSYNTWDQTLESAYSNLSDYNEGKVCWHPRISAVQRDYDEKGTSYDVTSVFYYQNVLDEQGTIDYSETRMKYACWDINTESGERRRFGSGTVDVSFDTFMESHLAEGSFEVRNRLFDNNAQRNFYALSWTIPAQPKDAQAGIEGHDSAAVFWTADAQYAYQQGYMHIDNIEHCTMGTTSWDAPMKSTWFYTLASENGGDRLLRRLTMTAEPSDGTAQVSFSSEWPIGQISNADGYVCDERAKRLYAVRKMEGTAPELEDYAQEALNNGAKMCGTYSAMNSKQAEHLSIANGDDLKVEQYQLLCAHYDYQNDNYYDFFPLAELDFAPDYTIPLNLESGNYEFIMGSITDLDSNQMNVYHVAIPQAMGLQLEGASAVSHCAMPGDSIKCQVRVTNTGNTPIIGFDATLWDDALGAAVDTTTLANLASAVQFSEDMVRPIYTEDGLPTNEYEEKKDLLDLSGVLWPGRVRNYYVMFNLPEDIEEGQQSFHITVANPVKERSMLVGFENDQADDENLCLAVDPRARGLFSQIGAWGVVNSSRIEPYCSIDHKPDGKTPDTGDGSGGVTTAALAAAAAAGLVAAGAKLHDKLAEEDN